MIEYLEHHIVDHCNLNCAGCTHFSPLVQEPWFEKIEDFEKDFQELASKVQVRTIRIMGGEPLLHPQVCDFLRIAREIFPTSEIQLVTNGILLEKRRNELLPLCNNLHITICTSNYHLNFNINEALRGFQYRRIDEKGNLYNASIILDGSYDTNKAFSECDLHVNRWYYFQNGRFYPCCIVANVHYFKDCFKCDIQEGNINDISISIHNHSEEDIKSFLNKPIPFCKYCNTYIRQRSYTPFHISKKDIKEWTYQ